MEKFNHKYDINSMTRTQTSAPETTTGEPARTLCRPQFSDGDRPVDTLQTGLPAMVLDVSEFDSTKEPLAI